VRALLILLPFLFSFGAVAQDAANEKTLDKLHAIVVPKLDFRVANIADVVTFLVETSRERDRDKGPDGKGIGLNIAVDIKAPVPPVSISLRRVSLHDALDFICDLTGLERSLESGTVMLTMSSPIEKQIAQKLDELGKSLGLNAEQAKQFQRTAEEIKALAAKGTPVSDPEPPEGFFDVPKGGGGFFGD